MVISSLPTVPRQGGNTFVSPAVSASQLASALAGKNRLTFTTAPNASALADSSIGVTITVERQNGAGWLPVVSASGAFGHFDEKTGAFKPMSIGFLAGEILTAEGGEFEGRGLRASITLSKNCTCGLIVEAV